MKRILLAVLLSSALIGAGLPVLAEGTSTDAKATSTEKLAKHHKKGKKHKKETSKGDSPKASDSAQPVASAEKAAK